MFQNSRRIYCCFIAVPRHFFIDPGFQMSAPTLRAAMELDCTRISRGEDTKEAVVERCISKMKECFQICVAVRLYVYAGYAWTDCGGSGGFISLLPPWSSTSSDCRRRTNVTTWVWPYTQKRSCAESFMSFADKTPRHCHMRLCSCLRQNAHQLDAAVAQHFSPLGSSGGESRTVRGGRGFSRCGLCGTAMDLKKSSSGR